MVERKGNYLSSLFLLTIHYYFNHFYYVIFSFPSCLFLFLYIFIFILSLYFAMYLFLLLLCSLYLPFFILLLRILVFFLEIFPFSFSLSSLFFLHLSSCFHAFYFTSYLLLSFFPLCQLDLPDFPLILLDR